MLPGPRYVDHHEAVSLEDVITDIWLKTQKNRYHHCVLESEIALQLTLMSMIHDAFNECADVQRNVCSRVTYWGKWLILAAR